MLVEATTTIQTVPNGTGRVPRARLPGWRRRRGLVIACGLVLLFGAVGLVLSRPSSPSTPVASPAAAPLIAHGQVLPARQARIGTLTGGVLQELETSPGDQVAAQTPIAWVSNGSATEIVTAPFAGSTTNVLVHAGDTLLPGATIAVVADLHTLQVETSDVDEFLINHVSLGQQVQVSVDAVDGLTLPGIIVQAAVLPQTSTSGALAYPITIMTGALPPEVRPGMSVRITFP